MARLRCGPRRPLPAGFLLHAVRGCRTRNPLRCLSQECRICCEEYAHGSRKRILPCNHGLHPAACLRPPTISSPHPPLLHSRPIAFHPACVDLWLLGSREQGPPRGERVCPICKARPPIPLPSPPHMTWRVPPTVLAPSLPHSLSRASDAAPSLPLTQAPPLDSFLLQARLGPLNSTATSRGDCLASHPDRPPPAGLCSGSGRRQDAQWRSGALVPLRAAAADEACLRCCGRRRRRRRVRRPCRSCA